MHSLPLFHRIAGSRVVVVGHGDAADAKARLVERAGGIVVSEAEAHGARLAFVALEDAREAEKACLRLKRLGLLVNVADRPELCDFTLPSVLDRDPVLVAVSTGGASAGLAKHLRLRLEAAIPPAIGGLAKALGAARGAIRARFPDAGDRRRALDQALREGGTLDPLDAGSVERLPAWLDGGETSAPAALYDFTIASNDAEDLTLRQARLLGMADTVLHDPDIGEAILNRARADAVRHVLPVDPPQTGVTVILRCA